MKFFILFFLFHGYDAATEVITPTILPINHRQLHFSRVQSTNPRKVQNAFDPKKDIIFELYTSDHMKPNATMHIDDDISKKFPHANFGNAHKTSILVHGLFATETMAKELSKAYFKNKDNNRNVIFVNWRDGIEEKSDDSKKNENHIRIVGDYLHKFLVKLGSAHPHHVNDIEIVCHGVGCYVSGHGAKLYQSHQKKTIPKMIALDASKKGVPNDVHLNNNAFKEIVAIHTNSFIGDYNPYGTVDIYVNGGKRQPGCPSNLIDFGQCSHKFAFKYYAFILKIDTPLEGLRSRSFKQMKAMIYTEEVIVFAAGVHKQTSGIVSLSTQYWRNSPSITDEVRRLTENAKSHKVSDALKQMKQEKLDNMKKRIAEPSHFCSFHLYQLIASDVEPVIYSNENLTLDGDFDEFRHYFNASRKTIIMIHGMLTTTTLVDNLQEAFSRETHLENGNLIGVDWSKWVNRGQRIASSMITTVGKHVSNFIRTVLAGYGFNADKGEFVGHDLGCHVIAAAVKELRQNRIKFPLFIALDPVSSIQAHNRHAALEGADAKRLIIFHSSEREGTFEVNDAVDIYLNGGGFQPGCDDDEDFYTCSKMFAHDYYAFIINSEKPLIVYRSDSLQHLIDFRSRFNGNFDHDMNVRFPQGKHRLFGRRHEIPDNGIYYMSSVYPTENILPALERKLEYEKIQYPWRYLDKYDVQNDVEFVLHVPPDANGKVELRTGNDFYGHSSFKTNADTIFFIHGYSSNAEISEYISESYFRIIGRYNVNFVGINWSRAAVWSYWNVKKRVEDVGKHIAMKIEESGGRLNVSRLQCVGHSLGAHVCGNMGATLKERFVGTIPKIIGLDPAGFDLEGRELDFPILGSGQATKVVSVHTNGNLLGYWGKIGGIEDLDIYLNGGRKQPQCAKSWLPNCCSHSFAHVFYNNMLNDDESITGIKSWIDNENNPDVLTHVDETQVTIYFMRNITTQADHPKYSFDVAYLKESL